MNLKTLSRATLVALLALALALPPERISRVPPLSTIVPLAAPPDAISRVTPLPTLKPLTV